MPNRHNCCFTHLSDEEIQKICSVYLEKSQAAVCEQFGITRYALLRIIKNAGVQRDRYGAQRNAMVSKGIKKTLRANPEIVSNRTQKHHVGAKRSLTSCEKMQKSAWARMQQQKNRFVSKIETKFGHHLSQKLGVVMQPQFRVDGKPFDFLCENQLLIEFDGPHHYNPDYFLWKKQLGGFEKQQERDRLRYEIAHRNGYRLLVIQQKQVNRRGELSDDTMHLIMKELGHESL